MDQKTEIVKTEEAKESSKTVSRKEIVRFVATVLFAIVLCNVVFAFHVVPSGSMEPTIKTNSFALCWRLPYIFGDKAPEYGDIVSFRSAEKNRILIKRVIGLPGDTIEFVDGYVIRNGEKIDEPYVMEQGTTRYLHDECTFTVPENAAFVLGDNREQSADSRSFTNPYVSFSDLYAKMLVAFHLP